jgi:hypothetical protein
MHHRATSARGLLALGLSAAALATAPEAPAQPPPPTQNDSRGGNGYPDQKPVAGWLKEIASRQARVRSLTAEYEMQSFVRGRLKPLIESGVAKFRFPEDPAQPPLERWDGKGEQGKILRIIRDGKTYFLAEDKTDRRGGPDPERLAPSAFRFPLLPEGVADRQYVFHSREFEPGETGPAADRPFPTSLGFMPRPEAGGPPRLKRFYLGLDGKNALASRLRWLEATGLTVEVELFDARPDAPVTDADFTPPPGASVATAPGRDPERKDGDRKTPDTAKAGAPK